MKENEKPRVLSTSSWMNELPRAERNRVVMFCLKSDFVNGLSVSRGSSPRKKYCISCWPLESLLLTFIASILRDLAFGKGECVQTNYRLPNTSCLKKKQKVCLYTLILQYIASSEAEPQCSSLHVGIAQKYTLSALALRSDSNMLVRSIVAINSMLHHQHFPSLDC